MVRLEKEKNNYDVNTWWDIGKRRIKDISIWCSEPLAKEKYMTINTLENELRHMKEHNAEYINVKNIKSKLQRYMKKKLKG